MTARTIHIATLTRAAAGDCDDQRTCPGVHTLADRPDVYYVVVKQVTDPDELTAFARHLGPGETLGTTPRSVIDEVPR
jgi:hypothetical protein